MVAFHAATRCVAALAAVWFSLSFGCSAIPSEVRVGDTVPFELTFSYEKPKSRAYQELFETLRGSQILEAWTNYVNRNLKPMSGRIEASFIECGKADSSYDAKKQRIVLCYEEADRSFHTLVRLVYQDENELLIAWIGTMLYHFYHELGHALVEILSMPVLGKEEDTADQFAVIALLRHPHGWNLALGAADYFHALTPTGSRQAPGSTHGDPLRSERSYTVLCLVYGSDPLKHGHLVDKGRLPQDRAESCRAEYYRTLYEWGASLNVSKAVRAGAILQRDAARALVSASLTWIAAETGLVKPPPPSIKFVSQDVLKNRSGAGHSTMALYERNTATIYLPSDWDGTLMYDRAMLLHEVVHHVQEFNSVPARCAAERERQGYAVTLKWLAEQGVADPYAVLQVDDFTIAILSACLEPE
jgi:hypothetical protein